MSEIDDEGWVEESSISKGQYGKERDEERFKKTG